MYMCVYRYTCVYIGIILQPLLSNNYKHLLNNTTDTIQINIYIYYI